MKTLGNILLFVGIPMCTLIILQICRKPVHRYTGEVISVSSLYGSAVLRTKTETGKDTLIDVRNSKRERFIEGQIITVWTGGDLIGNFGTTRPQ
jgi:hypothetical protein